MSLILSGITWILSYRCNLSCQHCFFEVKGPLTRLDPGLAQRALNSLEQHGPLSWQHVSGGEPLLFEQDLHRLLDVIREHGSKTVGIATNGFWGESQQRAEKTVSMLKKHGANGVCISADKFHQQEIPFEYVRTAAEHVARQDLAKHSFIVCCYPEGDSPPAEVDDFALPFAPVPIRKIGKGGTVAIEKVSKNEGNVPVAPCRKLCCCLGETSPFAPQMVWIDPYGNVMICYGLTIGRLHENSLGEILKGYTVNQSPLLAALADEGPIGLYRMAVDKGWQPVDSFADECDLCWQARHFLRDFFPATLGPDECYPETQPTQKND